MTVPLARPSLPPLAVIPTAKLRVYVVDDHSLIRHALVQLIAFEADMECCGDAATAEDGFAQIEKLRPDVVIVDLARNGNSALVLIKRVRDFDRNIGIIVISMSSESFYGVRSLKAGANGYVPKQEAPFKVVDAIRQIRAGRIYASSELAKQLNGDGVAGLNRKGRASQRVLTDREREVVELIGDGSTTSEIAMRLHESVRAVEVHRTHIKQKLHLENSAQLVDFCVRWVQEKEKQAQAEKDAQASPAEV
jgi:DNA-binding NarL/FixJ family response regulator